MLCKPALTTFTALIRPIVFVLLALALATPVAVSAQPTDFDVYVSEAILAVEDKQWDKAIDLLKTVLAG